jgi:hypothetical protein
MGGGRGRLELGDEIMRYKSVVEDRWGGSVKQGKSGPKVPEMGRQEKSCGVRD